MRYRWTDEMQVRRTGSGGQTDRWSGEQMNRHQVDRCTDGQDTRADEQTDRCTDGQMGGWADVRMDRWIDEQM